MIWGRLSAGETKQRRSLICSRDYRTPTLRVFSKERPDEVVSWIIANGPSREAKDALALRFLSWVLNTFMRSLIRASWTVPSQTFLCRSEP